MKGHELHFVGWHLTLTIMGLRIQRWGVEQNKQIIQNRHTEAIHHSNEHIKPVPHHIISNNVIGFHLILFRQFSSNSAGKHLSLT